MNKTIVKQFLTGKREIIPPVDAMHVMSFLSSVHDFLPDNLAKYVTETKNAVAEFNKYPRLETWDDLIDFTKQQSSFKSGGYSQEPYNLAAIAQSIGNPPEIEKADLNKILSLYSVSNPRTLIEILDLLKTSTINPDEKSRLLRYIFPSADQRGPFFGEFPDEF